MVEPVTPGPGASHMQFLRVVRKYELELSLRYFPECDGGKRVCSILEIGAGTGQQSKQLAQVGYDVFAIDVPQSRYRGAREYEVSEYDGRHFPVESDRFDVVFSSNVLEHVVHIDDVLREAYRVLKPGGTCVHLIPSPSCRFWSIPAHYVWLLRRIGARLMAIKKKPVNEEIPRTPTSAREWLGTLFPLRHGERGNTLTELFYFSRYFWGRKFTEHGFNIVEISDNRIFYTMSNAFGSLLGLKMRCRLSKVLGSSCVIYIMKK